MQLAAPALTPAPAPSLPVVADLLEQGIATAVVASYSPETTDAAHLRASAATVLDAVAMLHAPELDAPAVDIDGAVTAAKNGAKLLGDAATAYDATDVPEDRRMLRISGIAYDAYDALNVAYGLLGVDSAGAPLAG